MLSDVTTITASNVPPEEGTTSDDVTADTDGTASAAEGGGISRCGRYRRTAGERPLPAGPRTDIVRVSGVSAGQRKAWLAAAGGNGRLAVWVRRAADEKVSGKAGASLAAADIDRLEAVLTDLRRALNVTQVGNNVNQISRILYTRVRMGRRVSGEPYALALAQLAEAHSAMRDEIAGALRTLRGLRP